MAAVVGMGRSSGVSTIQKWAWLYAALFTFVVAVSHAPGLTDADGNLFGLFHIDPLDDVVHAVSGIWAALAAWRSPRAAWLYFLLFGTFYTSDAVIGLITGWSLIEFFRTFSLWPGYDPADVMGNLPANLPHFLLGPGALLIASLWRGARRRHA